MGTTAATRTTTVPWRPIGNRPPATRTRRAAIGVGVTSSLCWCRSTEARSTPPPPPPQKKTAVDSSSLCLAYLFDKRFLKTTGQKLVRRVMWPVAPWCYPTPHPQIGGEYTSKHRYLLYIYATPLHPPIGGGVYFEAQVSPIYVDWMSKARGLFRQDNT